ncbi:transforming growth factor beta regulator 1-like [Mytilus edulis]|uniref:transforming growth factor beta regulator 1-like n=1 Tax=Mytilus edulis TaxID=6550 RepID=UPI0039EDF6DD
MIEILVSNQSTMAHENKRLFNEDSAFLMEYQANQKIVQKSPQQISLLSGKIRSNLPGSLLQQQASRLTSGVSSRSLAQKQYYRKLKRLKKVVKDLIFVNAAICDEVVRVEEKVAKVKEERRFLLRKVLHYQSQSDIPAAISKTPPSIVKVKEEPIDTQTKAKPKKKPDKKRPPTTKQILEGLPPPKPKKGGKNQPTKKVIPPLQLDSLGRPVFPLIIGDLTIHSIGEIVVDRPGFHSVSNIYPEGFCSTRVYVDVNNVDNRCLYTCKISDGGKGPVFEIASEESPGVVFYSRSISDCHNQLIKAVKKNKKLEFLEQTGKGADFFGLSHPVTQNLIQSCPGSKRCTGYRWVKFEINKNADTVEMDALDPTTSHTALKIVLNNGSKLPEPSSNLRSLLTNKALMNTAKVRQT